MFKRLFLGKTPSFYLCLCVGLLAIVCGIIFFICDRSIMGNDIHFNDFSHMTLIFLIAAGVVTIVDALTSIPFVGVASCALMGCALGSHIYIACFPLADITQPVAFFTNDIDKARSAVTLFMIFLAIFLVITLVLIVNCFLSEKRKAE